MNVSATKAQRPTPQPKTDGVRPRFREMEPNENFDPETNPYLLSHKEFGEELLSAGEAWPWRGRWAERFGRVAPLVVEVGAGVGDFFAALATLCPDRNHVGVELRYKRCVRIASRIRQAGVRNAVAVRYHAAYLDDLFEDGSVDTLWLNHPDPWPRDRQEKHRLVAPWFLQDCARLLRTGGSLYLRTDADHHIDALDAMLPDLPFEVTGREDDLHNNPPPWTPPISTHYQNKMRTLGRRVRAVALRRR